MMGEFFYAYQCNDLYGEGGLAGVRYGFIEAVDMRDARQSLGNRRRGSVSGVKLEARNIRKIKFNQGELAGEYAYLAQPVRRAIYEGARTRAELDALVPGWRDMGRDDDWLRG